MCDPLPLRTNLTSTAVCLGAQEASELCFYVAVAYEWGGQCTGGAGLRKSSKARESVR